MRFLLIFALALIALVVWILWRTRGRSRDPGDSAQFQLCRLCATLPAPTATQLAAYRTSASRIDSPKRYRSQTSDSE